LGIPVVQVGSELVVTLLERPRQLLVIPIAQALVPGLECAAIDRDEFPAEQLQFLTQQAKGPADLVQRVEVIFAEIRNRFEIGTHLFQQPEPLEVGLAFRFEKAAGADAIEVAVDRELQEIAGMLGATAGRGGHGTAKAAGLKVKLIDEGVDEANRIVRCEILVEGRRKEEDRVRLDTLDMWQARHSRDKQNETVP
jgi:hypothetical protein